MSTPCGWMRVCLGAAPVVISLMTGCAHGSNDLAVEQSEIEDPNSVMNARRPGPGIAERSSYEQQLRAAEAANPDSVDSPLPPPGAVIQRLHVLDRGEIAAGQLAQQKGGPSAAAYGGKLLAEHQATERTISELADKLHVGLDELGDQRALRKLADDREIYERLVAAQGPEFDKMFARQMDSEQHKDFASVKSLRGRCVEPRVCALLDRMLSILQSDAEGADRLTAALASDAPNDH